MDLNSIKRNSDNFSFLDTLAGFVNNLEFRAGYDNLKRGESPSKSTYLWEVLSAIGEDYAETIYSNVLNYIDNVANVDLCKVKALQSMVQMIGLDYNVSASYENFPVEIMNFMDIMSVNRHYLVDNKTFAQTVVEELSAFSTSDISSCFQQMPVYSSLSDEISPEINDQDAEMSSWHGISSITQLSTVLNDNAYKVFLVKMYKSILTSFIYMKYKDAEHDLSTVHEYVYEYLTQQLQSKSNTVVDTSDAYDREIKQLKFKNKLDKGFDQAAIVDAIENGYDTADRYNVYQQAVLLKEIERRQATYSYAKPYSNKEQAFGFNITRYSYYREKKVKEYFKFIDDTYNSLVQTTDIIAAVEDNSSDTRISVYQQDLNYFEIDQTNTKSLLTYDEIAKEHYIQTQYIDAVAELLAKQTLDLAEMREQVKLTIRKAYMKGTFLLLSYIVNEFLKHNIADKYGDMFYTDENVSLSTMINRSITDGGNVELIEYVDDTEYYNISSDTDVSAYALTGAQMKNRDLVNPKFWDNETSKIGVTTNDLPIDQIETFYREQMLLKNYGADDVTEFLSIIFEYGANDSYMNAQISDDTGFICRSHDGSWMKDPDTEINTLNLSVDTAQSIYDEVQKCIENGYVLELGPVKKQIENLSSWISSYWHDEISSANKETVNTCQARYENAQETVNWLSSDFDSLASDFNDLSTNGKYSIYLKDYDPSSVDGIEYLYTQLITLEHAASMDDIPEDERHGADFHNNDLSVRLIALSCGVLSGNAVVPRAETPHGEEVSGYVILKQHLLDDLIELSVRNTFWPNYFAQENDELTAQTQDLATYLAAEAASIESEQLQHMQNHLTKLLSYKNDVNNMIETFVETSAMYLNLENTIVTGTGKEVTAAYTSQFTYWDQPVYNDDHSKILGWTHATYSESVDAIKNSDPIPVKAQKLNERCNLLFSATLDQRKCYSCGDTAIHTASTSKKWADLFSESLASQIDANLNNLVTDFDTVKRFINNELTCLNPAGGEYAPITVTADTNTVGNSLNTLYAALIDRISTLDDKVRRKVIVTTDQFITKEGSKLEQIRKILNSTPIRYNVAWINEHFYALEEAFKQCKQDFREYLKEHSDLGSGTLLDQIKELIQWIANNDHDNNVEFLDEIGKLVAQYVAMNQSIQDSASAMSRPVVEGISDALDYIISWISIDDDGVEYASDYIELNLTAINEWLMFWTVEFEKSVEEKIHEKIPEIESYKTTVSLLKILFQFFKDQLDVEDKLITDLILAFISGLKDQIAYVESQRGHYEIQKEIYLKYNGTDIGYDPFYNYKNQTHSSYQIHPYLYSFFEKSNVIYPLANSFYIAFSSEYERELVDKGLDNLIGKFGNIINLWKYDMQDWTGIQSEYEYRSNTPDTNQTTYVANCGFTGAFYPPALDDFLNDTETFIQNVQDNSKQSYYYHLNLTDMECQKIAEQLRVYEKPIREIAQATKGSTPEQHNLSNEYDIYKYAEDAYGNSLILFKSYRGLYQRAAAVDSEHLSSYVPTANEKRDVTGELWMRIKDHPIAFPAFDLRQDFVDIAQYNVKTSDMSVGKELNGYIREISEYFKQYQPVHLLDLSQDEDSPFWMTADTISRTSSSIGQMSHTRMFYDMEMDVTKRVLLLNVPYMTGSQSDDWRDGTNAKVNPPRQFVRGSELANRNSSGNMTYTNSSVVVGVVEQVFDYSNLQHIYSFTKDNTEYSNIDEISNPGADNGTKRGLLKKEEFLGENARDDYYEFLGFSSSSEYVFAVFARKFYSISIGATPTKMKCFINPGRHKTDDQIQLYYVGYKYNSNLKENMLLIPKMKYDILYTNDTDCRYANNVMMTTSAKHLTLGFATQQVQTDDYEKNNTQIVNFAEYTAMVEKNRDTETYGSNTTYPAYTALLQTKDSQHINIYNSFDSFTSYLVNISLKFVGSKLVLDTTRYFNINTDLGYLPLFADKPGKSRLWNNSALSGQESYNLELLGPEQSDLPFTPVLTASTDEKYGRVTEDYKEFNKYVGYNDVGITIPANDVEVSYTFYLSALLSDAWGDIIETNQLLGYKYMFTNTKYPALPIAKGVLSTVLPTGNYYLSSEMYDLLSGQEIIGPNNVSYQNVNASNHITNLSAIDLSVNYDSETELPVSLTMTCKVRRQVDTDQVIDPQTFQLLVYQKNNVKSYDYYHIIENANSQIAQKEQISYDEMDDIDFAQISALSSYVMPDGKKKPFVAKNTSDRPDLLSADLEFKYSEEDTINREFPYLDAEDIEDEIVILENNEQYIYYFALDSFDTINQDVFYMEKYNPDAIGSWSKVKVNTTSGKYRDFYNKALTIETTYNVERVYDDVDQWGVVMYFNYKNYTSPCYISFDKSLPFSSKNAHVHSSADDEIKSTYLRLEPGQSGKLDIRIDYVEYAKLNAQDIAQSVIGKETKIIQTYYVMNVSDEKPKFIISRKPFTDGFEEKVLNTVVISEEQAALAAK